MPYLGKQSEQVGVSIQKYEFLQATDTSSGTTSFSVPSDSGDHVNVWLNGVLLVEGGSDDYSKSNTAITFNSAPADGDIIRIDVVESFALPDALKSSGDTMTGALKLDGGIKQQTSADLSGTYADHQVMLSDSYSVTGDVTSSENLVLAKISDDSNAVSLTNDTSTRTITGTGSLEASTLVQTPNASLTGMTGEIGSAVTGTLGSGFAISSGITVPSNNYIKTYHTLLAHGYTNSSTITNYGSGQGLPATTDGVLVGTSPNIVLDGTQEVFCFANQQMGEWQQNGQTLMVCWGTKDGGSTYQFMGGNESGSHSTMAFFSWKAGTGGRHGLLPAGTWVFTVRMGVGAAQTYGSWWGGSGVYGGDQWGHPGTIGPESSTAGNMIIQVGGST